MRRRQHENRPFWRFVGDPDWETLGRPALILALIATWPVHYALVWFADRLKFGIRTSVVIDLMSSGLDSDTAPLIKQVVQRFSVDRIRLIAADRDAFLQKQRWFLQETKIPESSVLERTTSAARRALVGASIVFLRQNYNRAYIPFLCGALRRRIRVIVFLRHGLETKFFSRNRETHETGPRRRLPSPISVVLSVILKFAGFAEAILVARHHKHWIMPMDSLVGIFFVTGRFASAKWGLPRSDRCRELIAAEHAPWLPPKTQRWFREHRDSRLILFAPTSQSLLDPRGGPRLVSPDQMSPFPFPVDLRRLSGFLREQDAIILWRAHHTFERYDAVPGEDESVIIDAGGEFAFSATELMPHLDLLITDVSSIYVEFLAFDRPLTFLSGDFGPSPIEFPEFFPGSFVDSQQGLHAEIAASLADPRRGKDARSAMHAIVNPPLPGKDFVDRMLGASLVRARLPDQDTGEAHSWRQESEVFRAWSS